ncbi:MAG TPA: flagellar protein FlgN [Gallionella sp.]|nr:flagellar protein FlgN [Gallionella sp.]
MEPASVARILAALAAEHAALLNFVALLEREQTMLVENLTGQLLELSEKKTTGALDLNKLGQERRALLQEVIQRLDADTIQAWLGANCPHGLAIWQQTLTLAKRSHLLNQTNGELIHMKLRHNQQSLAVLSNALNKANLYGPDGQPNFSPGSGRTLGNG